MSKIGIITNDKAQVFQREIIAGVQDVAGDKIEVLVDSIAENPDTRRPISLDIDELDGILVISNILSHDELQSLHQRGKPITLVSHQEEDLPIAAVIQNNTDGILQLVDYVARECGRTQIVFIRGDMNQHDGRQRDNLFQMGLMQHDLTTPDDYNLVGDFNPVTAANSMLEFLETGKPFDAVIAADYLNILHIPGSGELVIFSACFLGACIGFLWYNAFPAQIFMGDTGSLTLGGIIAAMAILIRKEWLIPILCGIFLAENLSVVLQVSYFKYTKKKYGEGRRIFKMSPLHHHYQKLGYAEPKIVTRFWIVGIMLAVFTIVTFKLR